MTNIAERVDHALALQEARVERGANRARLGFVAVVGAIALANAPAVTAGTNLINFGAIGIALAYSVTVSVWLRRVIYRATMKYATSLIDIALVYLVLLAYTLHDTPAVALKNPAFFIVYPLIGMTVFRYDPRLTLVSGGFAFLAYGSLFAWALRFIDVKFGDYAAELYGPGVTVVGQLTKIMVLAAFVGLMALLARYTRSLLHRLVQKEVEARSRREKIERELELASQVQSHLLPRTWPVLERLSLHATILEGQSVGGDYYDLIPLSAHSVLLIVADVAGKGVPAALIMSGMRAAAHLCASMRLGIEETLERMNRLLYDSTAPHHYVTAFVAEIDMEANRICYVNAGHPPPLLFSGNRILRLREGPPPLGLFPSLPELHFQRAEMPPGSMLVACTDGVSERTNSAGEEFGDQALHRFVQENGSMDCGAFAQNLLAALKQFGDNRPYEDDVTLVVAKCAGQNLAA
jgi:hypothetical protein